MGMNSSWTMYRVHYLEDGTEQSFVTIADGEAGCRRNLQIFRGDSTKFLRNEEWQKGDGMYDGPFEQESKSRE